MVSDATTIGIYRVLGEAAQLCEVNSGQNHSLVVKPSSDCRNLCRAVSHVLSRF